MGSQGIRLIAERGFLRLKTLSICTYSENLVGNYIGKQGVVYLSRGNWNTVEDLFIGQNKIGN